jgi:hypothetical protein
MNNEGLTPRGRNGVRDKRELQKRRAIWWSLLLLAVLLIIFGGKTAYHWLKAKRADQFATDGDALFQAGNLNDAAGKYRVALQLDPLGYHGLVGAARLASRADRPEAVNLWEQVIKLSQSTVADRQDYADLLLRSNQLNLAEKIVSGLLKNDPDPRSLQLGARYSKKIGEAAKAVEFARLAVKRAPNDGGSRFQLAELLAESTDSADRAEARQVLWEVAGQESIYKKPAIEALGRAPELSTEERNRVLQALASLASKSLTDDLIAADLRIQLQSDDTGRIYDEIMDHWRGGKNEELIELARWLNVHQQPERVLSLFTIDRGLENNQLLLTRLDALAILQRWIDIDDVLNRPELTLDPSVIESFRARTAQERNAILDAEVHWNHAISLAGTDPFKLRFVANFAEQSHASAAALKAYEQLARFPEHAALAYRGTQRVSEKIGEARAQRSATAKIAALVPDDPNAADQLAYLNLLLNDDVEKNFALAKNLADKYPNRLSYRVTAALGYLRQHNAGSALAQFNAPVPIDWTRTQPAWRAVYAATLLANDRNDEARKMIATIPRDRLSAQERALIEPPPEGR